MLFGNNDSMDAEEFWKEREKELGTAVLARALGQVVRNNAPAPLWGMLYTTEKALYFQTFYSENWLSTMFSGGRKGRSRTRDEIVEIPSDSIEYFRIRPTKTGFLKIFRQPSVVELRWTSPDTGEVEEMVFEMEIDAEDLISSISRPDRES